MKTKIIVISLALLFCACSAPLAYAPQEYPQQNPVQNQAQAYPQNPAQVYPQQSYSQNPQQTYPQNPVQTTSSQTQTPVYQNQAQAYPQNPAQNYAGVLPQNIMDYIQSNYPNTFIKDMDFEGYGWEIELSNNLDVYFDSNGNFLGAKWD